MPLQVSSKCCMRYVLVWLPGYGSSASLGSPRYVLQDEESHIGVRCKGHPNVTPSRKTPVLVKILCHFYKASLIRRQYLIPVDCYGWTTAQIADLTYTISYHRQQKFCHNIDHTVTHMAIFVTSKARYSNLLRMKQSPPSVSQPDFTCQSQQAFLEVWVSLSQYCANFLIFAAQPKVHNGIFPAYFRNLRYVSISFVFLESNAMHAPITQWGNLALDSSSPMHILVVYSAVFWQQGRPQLNIFYLIFMLCLIEYLSKLRCHAPLVCHGSSM